ncbi:hypothetical protein [Staphylococcus felis]
MKYITLTALLIYVVYEYYVYKTSNDDVDEYNHVDLNNIKVEVSE